MQYDTSSLDLREKGKDGQTLDRRLFMQFLAYGNCIDSETLIEVLNQSNVAGAMYADINDPRGIGLLVMHEDPDFFITDLRQLLTRYPFAELEFKPEYTMMGRTYAIGYEPDLEEAVINRPWRKILNPELCWAVWYPLRRHKAFETLTEQEQRVVLMEHGGIGMSFGKAGYATDIRLSCHGMDKNDNDFVVGVLGGELYPLSMVVQMMRKTKQTSQHLESLGPFFVGKVIWQSQPE